MSESFNKIPEPALPEHQLLREIADLPQLSTGLRQRVIVDVHRQIRYGRWADRLRVGAAVLAATLMVCLVWNFRWTGQEQVVKQKPAMEFSPPPVMPTPSTGGYSSADSLPMQPLSPQLPQGGPSSRTEMKEMQQLNKLIEDIQGRNNVLCGLLPVW